MPSVYLFIRFFLIFQKKRVYPEIIGSADTLFLCLLSGACQLIDRTFSIEGWSIVE